MMRSSVNTEAPIDASTCAVPTSASTFRGSIAKARSKKPLGIASGAMAAFVKSATQKKVRMGMTIRLQDREMVQSTVGRAEAIVGAARAFLNEAMTELLAALGETETGLCEPTQTFGSPAHTLGEVPQASCKCRLQKLVQALSSKAALWNAPDAISTPRSNTSP
jgi:hypothetical protein